MPKMSIVSSGSCVVQLPTLAPKFGTHWYEGAHFCKIARTAVSLGVFDVEARTAVSSGVFDVEARTAVSSDVFDDQRERRTSARSFFLGAKNWGRLTSLTGSRNSGSRQS